MNKITSNFPSQSAFTYSLTISGYVISFMGFIGGQSFIVFLYNSVTAKILSSKSHFMTTVIVFNLIVMFFYYVLQGLNNMRTLSTDNIHLLLDNLATYMNSISLETSATMWTNILNQFDVFFRRLSEILPVPCDMTSVLKIITCLLKVNGINNAKVIITLLQILKTISALGQPLF